MIHRDITGRDGFCATVGAVNRDGFVKWVKWVLSEARRRIRHHRWIGRCDQIQASNENPILIVADALCAV